MKKILCLLVFISVVLNGVCGPFFTGSFFGDGTGVTNLPITLSGHTFQVGQGLNRPYNQTGAGQTTNTFIISGDGAQQNNASAGDFFTINLNYENALATAQAVPATLVVDLNGDPTTYSESGLYAGFCQNKTFNNVSDGVGTNDGWSIGGAGAVGFNGNASDPDDNNGAGIGLQGFCQGNYQVAVGASFIGNSGSANVTTNVGIASAGESNGVAGSVAAGGVFEITPVTTDPQIETAAIIADNGLSANAPVAIFRVANVDTSYIDTNGSFKTLTAGVYTGSTNTLTVTSTGVTNNTAFDYLVSTSAGTAMAVKDANGNQFLAPTASVSDCFPLKPGWRFTGTGVTGYAVRFP